MTNFNCFCGLHPFCECPVHTESLEMSKSLKQSGVHVGFKTSVYVGNDDNGFYVQKDATGVTKYDEITKCLSVELDATRGTPLHNIRYVVQVNEYEIYPLDQVGIDDIGVLVVFNSDFNRVIKRGTIGRTYRSDVVDCIEIRIEDDKDKYVFYHIIHKDILGIVSKLPNQKSVHMKLSDFRSPTEIRIQWLKLIGLKEDEILESVTGDPTTSVEEEEAQFEAALKFYNIGK